MTFIRRGLVLVGTAALCAVAIAPSRVGDARVPVWMNVFRTAKSTLGRAASAVEQAVLDIGEAARHAAARTAGLAAPDAVPADPGPSASQAARDVAAARQANIVAADARIRALGYDPAGIEDAITAYRVDNLTGGDAAAAKIGNATVRTAVEWVALRLSSKIGPVRVAAFQAAHHDWPAKTWFRHLTEAHLARAGDPKVVEQYFAATAPVTSLGKYALARAFKVDNRPADAARIARALFRDGDMSGWLDGKVKAEFTSDLTKADYKYRADRLLYKEQVGPALHYAGLAGPDVLALAKARAALIADAPIDKTVATVPEPLRKDPGLILAEVARLRRTDKLMDAANLMQSVPRDPALLIDGDEWWTERRLLARRLLDNGNINAAYVTCATHTAASAEARVDAEFHAGWIALRFMNDPTRAAYHFAQAAKLAETPTSVARIAYWQGRTAENSTAPDAIERAQAFYRKAAEHRSVYYGQLARQLLGTATDAADESPREVTGDARIEAIRVVELLYAAGERDSASALAIDIASSLTDGRQLAAFAAVVIGQGDAHLALTVGKLIGQRGLAATGLAFPTFGIPTYDELGNSAPRPVVYSIARQESAFMPSVVSKAGAKGLMQIIDATAKRTASKANVPFDSARLTTDPAFNAQLGAAHLGELLAEQGGSYILTFAAYNAGGGRVKQWIDAYGDPRTPGVDPVDWIERIPFTETRNYVQRVLANLAVYQGIFAEQARTAAAGHKPDRQAKL